MKNKFYYQDSYGTWIQAKYKILNETTHLNLKRSLDIEIPCELNEQNLSDLSKKLHKPKYKLTFICYYLHGEKIDEGAYASASDAFGKFPNVEIYGGQQ